MKYTDKKDQLNKFEDIMDQYFFSDPVKKANESINQIIREYNELVEKRDSELKEEDEKLQKEIESLHDLEKRIKNIDSQLENNKIDSHDPTSVENYNMMVTEHNNLVKEHKKLYESYKLKEDAYNKKLHKSNQEIDEKKTQVETVKKKWEKIINEYNSWIKERGAEKFFNNVNRFYISLCQEDKKNELSAELTCYIDRIKRLRSGLGLYMQNRQNQQEDGLLIIKALFCDSEESYMIVDIGASLVSISPELVEILGITEYVGDVIELSLPAGIHIKAPQLLIPSISIDGKKAEYVKGVVLKESMAGVDGCIGLSFLNRFNYKIEKEHKNKLLLEIRKISTEHSEFDVFICHNSIDLPLANEIFEVIKKSGLKPFLSEVSIEKCGTNEFQKAIDTTLEFAPHLIVVCSSRENIESPWVEAEWRLFDGLKRSGKKRGHIIPIICGEMTEENLPLALSRYQSILINDPEWKTKLIHFLPR